MDLVEEDILMHYGVKRRSGRYPWGSGDNPYQHGGDFLARVEELQRLGKTEKQIADELHLSTTDLRMQVRVAKHERRALQADRARSLREDGKTLDEIASILGYANDSSVRALLNENTAANKNKAQATAEILKKELAEKEPLMLAPVLSDSLAFLPVSFKRLFSFWKLRVTTDMVLAFLRSMTRRSAPSHPSFPFLRSTRERFIRTLIW